VSYLVLARRWRPQLFSDVIGQKHVTDTIENAITSNRIPHAFLFAGPRGVGKTSVARILAKALNCINGPTNNPCNKCSICEEITNGHSLDVIEIDGASNTSVEDIRGLRDNIRYLPSRSKYKIYIIDEVHMLSNSAFNALLKTLEEPPGHAIFIFATTEPHKIPLTVISRCQRYDFKRISIKDIIDNLKNIASKDKIDISDDAIFLIAREADGSLRDAQSILDQIVSYKGNNISQEDVISLLGIMDRKVIYDLLRSIIEKNADKSLKIIEDIYNYGYDLKRFLGELLDLFRNLMIVKTTTNYKELINLPDYEIEELLSFSKSLKTEEIQMLLSILLRGEEEFLRSDVPKLILEITIIKMLHIEPFIPINEIIDRLEELEKRLGSSQDIPVKKDDVNTKIENPSWDGFIDFLKSKKPLLFSLLEGPKSIKIDEGGIFLSFDGNNSFRKESLKDKETIDILRRLAEEYFKRGLDINISIEESNNREKHDEKRINEDLLNDPFVQHIVDIFGGEIVEIKRGK
jgi:DNA polymerase-3 subunit gamma/tau